MVLQNQLSTAQTERIKQFVEVKQRVKPSTSMDRDLCYEIIMGLSNLFASHLADDVDFKTRHGVIKNQGDKRKQDVEKMRADLTALLFNLGSSKSSFAAILEELNKVSDPFGHIQLYTGSLYQRERLEKFYMKLLELHENAADHYSKEVTSSLCASNKLSDRNN
jgi:hypothetical protein